MRREHTVGHLELNLFAQPNVSLSVVGIPIANSEKRVLPLTKWCWDGDLRWPQWSKRLARGIIRTIKTFCIDQTKSFVELYAFKVVMEIAKIMILMNFHDFQGKTLIFMKIPDFHDFRDHFKRI